jgi:TusA-related sulfurtransferase
MVLNNKNIRLKIILNDEYIVPSIVEMFVKHGLKVLSVNKNNPTLEDVYIRYVSGVKGNY